MVALLAGVLVLVAPGARKEVLVDGRAWAAEEACMPDRDATAPDPLFGRADVPETSRALEPQWLVVRAARDCGAALLDAVSGWLPLALPVDGRVAAARSAAAKVRVPFGFGREVSTDAGFRPPLRPLDPRPFPA